MRKLTRPCGGFSPVHAEQRRSRARLHATAAVGRHQRGPVGRAGADPLGFGGAN
jgi:hypothetical protein